VLQLYTVMPPSEQLNANPPGVQTFADTQYSSWGPVQLSLAYCTKHAVAAKVAQAVVASMTVKMMVWCLFILP
jgi:hypothetical protein